MGRGRRGTSAGAVPRAVARARYEVLLADSASAEMTELLTYIAADSPQNAASVLAAIDKRLTRLRQFPQTGHADPNAPAVPLPGAEARQVTVKGVAIRYLFPVAWAGRDVVYVVMIRRGSRQPLTDPQLLALWQAELAALQRRDAPPTG